MSLFIDIAPRPKMHVYAPDQKDYIPVALALASDAAYKGAAPQFPKAETYFFAPLKETQRVYSKPFRIVQPVTLAPTAIACLVVTVLTFTALIADPQVKATYGARARRVG